MKETFWEHLQNQFTHFLFEFGAQAIYAIITFVIGILFIKFTMKIIRKIMNRSRTELSLRSFIDSFCIVLLYAALIYVVGRILGIKASAFLTIFGAAGIAIGLALQGSLSNFAGGLLILVFKPFKIGDEVVIDGIQGVVQDINILYTKINDWRGQVYTMPNGKVSNNSVKNNSADQYRRVEISLRFSFDEDFDNLRKIITEAMKELPLACQDRPFQLWLNSFEEYYLNVSARCWAKTTEYWEVYWGQIEIIKKTLEKNKISLTIPKQKVFQPDYSSQ